jgi:hypothetical protein
MPLSLVCNNISEAVFNMAARMITTPTEYFAIVQIPNDTHLMLLDLAAINDPTGLPTFGLEHIIFQGTIDTLYPFSFAFLTAGIITTRIL